MQLLLTAGKSFLGTLVGILVATLATHLFGLGPFRPWMAFCIAASTALAVSAKVHWQLSQGAGAALIGLFVGVGAVAGLWLSAQA